MAYGHTVVKTEALTIRTVMDDSELRKVTKRLRRSKDIYRLALLRGMMKTMGQTRNYMRSKANTMKSKSKTRAGGYKTAVNALIKSFELRQLGSTGMRFYSGPDEKHGMRGSGKGQDGGRFLMAQALNVGAMGAGIHRYKIPWNDVFKKKGLGARGAGIPLPPSGPGSSYKQFLSMTKDYVGSVAMPDNAAKGIGYNPVPGFQWLSYFGDKVGPNIDLFLREITEWMLTGNTQHRNYKPDLPSALRAAESKFGKMSAMKAVYRTKYISKSGKTVTEGYRA